VYLCLRYGFADRRHHHHQHHQHQHHHHHHHHQHHQHHHTTNQSQTRAIHAYTNADSIELSVNGKSQGSRKVVPMRKVSTKEILLIKMS